MSITVEFNRQKMAEDAVAKGLTTNAKWAAKAKVSDMTVIRFKRGDRMDQETITKLAKPLGGVEQYILRKADEAVA